MLEAPFYLTKMLGEIMDQPVKLTCLALDQSGRNENVKIDVLPNKKKQDTK